MNSLFARSFLSRMCFSVSSSFGWVHQKPPFAVLMWFFFFHAVDSFLLSSHAFQTVLFKGIIVALPASFSESLFHNSLSAAAFWSRRAAFCFKIVDNMRWVSRIHVGFRRKPLEKELTSLALTDYLLHLCLDLGSRLCCVWRQWSIFLCLEFSNWVGGFFGDHFKEVLSLEVAWG